jgi:maltose alpha-D-glucosyltransferase/alpha-amylase
VASTSQAVELDLSEFAGRVPVEMLGGVAFPPIGQLTYLLTLPPYGFNWFVLASNSNMPSWHTPAPEPLPEFATLVLRGGIEELLVGRSRAVLETEALPQYLAKRRWYAAKQYGPPAVRIDTVSRMPEPADAQPGHVLVLAEVKATVAGEKSRYLIPVGFVGEDDPVAGLQQQLALARVRRGKEVGFITDAFALDRFALQMVDLMRGQARVPALDGEVRFDPTPALAETALPAAPEIRRISADQSNSSVVIGDAIVLKFIRKDSQGLHPEAEMGRFLTLNGFANTPAMLGEVSRQSANGRHYTLMMMQRFLHNQGDGWQWTLSTLERAAQDTALPPMDAAGVPVAGTITPMHEFETFVTTLGRRLGEMHSVLARPGSEPAFTPETADGGMLARWGQDALAQLDAAFKVLQAAHEFGADAAAQARTLLGQREALRHAVEQLAADAAGALAIRIHGDFHLGQVLVSSGDAWIVDFEGEPSKSLDQRRTKASPWRDVAGLLRSFDYAAAFSARGKEGATAPDARLLDEYRTISSRAFLDAYRANAPAGAEVGADALLKLFMVEKAAYELCYEAANRPAWLEVPLQGLARLAGALLADSPPEVA